MTSATARVKSFCGRTSTKPASRACLIRPSSIEFRHGATETGRRTLMRGAAGSGALSEQRDRENGDDENCAEQGEAVGVTHDRRLRSDCLADGDDGAVQGSRGVGEAVRNEILLQI